MSVLQSMVEVVAENYHNIWAKKKKSDLGTRGLSLLSSALSDCGVWRSCVTCDVCSRVQEERIRCWCRTTRSRPKRKPRTETERKISSASSRSTDTPSAGADVCAFTRMFTWGLSVTVLLCFLPGVWRTWSRTLPPWRNASHTSFWRSCWNTSTPRRSSSLTSVGFFSLKSCDSPHTHRFSLDHELTVTLAGFRGDGGQWKERQVTTWTGDQVLC